MQVTQQLYFLHSQLRQLGLFEGASRIFGQQISKELGNVHVANASFPFELEQELGRKTFENPLSRAVDCTADESRLSLAQKVDQAVKQKPICVLMESHVYFALVAALPAAITTVQIVDLPPAR